MDTRLLRWTAFFGVGAAAVYVAATASGSLLDSSYSQVGQHVSDLTGTGAPTRWELAPPYIIYNLLSAAFAAGVYLASNRNWLFKAATALLVINSIAGVMMVTFFTEDLGGSPTTFAGYGHIWFAAVSSLAIVTASVLYGFAFRRSPTWHGMSSVSFLVAAAFVVAAPFAVMTTAGHSGYAGLAERAAIAPFIIWLVVAGAGASMHGNRPGRPVLRSTATPASPT